MTGPNGVRRAPSRGEEGGAVGLCRKIKGSDEEKRKFNGCYFGLGILKLQTRPSYRIHHAGPETLRVDYTV